MPNIKLLDIDTKIMYTLEVSEEDAKKANEDTTYATQLLQNYLEKGHNDFSEEETKSNKSNMSIKSTKSVKKNDYSPASSPSPTSLVIDTSVTSVTKKRKTMEDSSEKISYMESYRWPHEAVLALFEVYQEEEHIISTGVSMKKFWNIVAARLNEKGYSINDTQCKSKMAGLRITYKNIKDYNSRHNYSCRKWPYLEIMDEMYKKKPWVSTVYKTTTKPKDDLSLTSPTLSTRLIRSTRSVKPKYVYEDDDEDDIEDNIYNEEKIDNMDNIEIEKIEKPNSPPPKPELSSKYSRQMERIISVVEENINERRRMHKEAMSRQDRLLHILEKMYNSIKDKNEAHTSETISPSETHFSTKRLNKFSTTEKLITTIEESNSKRSKMHEEVITRQDKLLDILEKMFEN